MNNRIKRIAKGMFEQFRHRKITESEFVQAEAKARNLGGYMDDFNVLIAMCKDTITGKYKMDKWNLSIIIGTIVYVVSPIDAIPDFILVGGWIDDVAIVGYAIRKLNTEMEQYKRSKYVCEN